MLEHSEAVTPLITPTIKEGFNVMPSHSNAIGALSRNELACMLRILEPYRTEPLTAAVVALAARLARREVNHAA